MDTVNELAALVVAGALAWIIVRLVRRSVERRERIRDCEPHSRWLDDSSSYGPVYRCRRCPWQTPAADVRREREKERVAALASRCPRCGEDLRGDGEH